MITFGSNVSQKKIERHDVQLIKTAILLEYCIARFTSFSLRLTLDYAVIQQRKQCMPFQYCKQLRTVEFHAAVKTDASNLVSEFTVFNFKYLESKNTVFYNINRAYCTFCIIPGR